MAVKDQINIYQTTDGTTSIDVILENDTIWLNQHQLAALTLMIAESKSDEKEMMIKVVG